MAPPGAATLAASEADPAAHHPPVDPALAQPMGFLEALGSLWGDLRGALTERAKLVALELRLAGMNLLRLVIYAVIVAILVVTAWLGLMGGVVVGFMSVGLHWALALGLGIAINLAVAAWLVRSMVKMIERVGLPASLRSIEGH